MKGTLLFDKRHVSKVHDRWIEKLDKSVFSRPGEDKENQCYSCRYYFPVCGNLIDDWGVCTNGQAAMDGRVVFEHAGCPLHHAAEKLWFDALREDDHKRFKQIQAREDEKGGKTQEELP